MDEYMEEQEDGCLSWTGSFESGWIGPVFWNGAGRISIRQISWNSHNHPKVNAKQRITTTCGKSRCVNPKHLKLYEVRPYTPAEKERVTLERNRAVISAWESRKRKVPKDLWETS